MCINNNKASSASAIALQVAFFSWELSHNLSIAWRKKNLYIRNSEAVTTQQIVVLSSIEETTRTVRSFPYPLSHPTM